MNHPPHRSTLKRKLITITMLACGCALLIVVAAFIFYDFTTYRKELAGHLLTRVKVQEVNNAAPLAFKDGETASENLAALSADSHILSAAIYDKDGQVFADYRRSPDISLPPIPSDGSSLTFWSHHLDASSAIILERDIIGHIVIRTDLTAQEERLQWLLFISIAVLALSLAVAYLIATRLYKTITVPIADLTHTAYRVSQQKDYTVQALKQNDDEIGLLADGFNDMLAQIRERDRQLTQTVQQLQHEISERTEAEGMLETTARKLEAVIRTSPLGIISLDRTGEHVVSWGGAAEQIFGWSEKEVLGKPLPIIPESDRERSLEIFNASNRTDLFQGVELRRLRKDGSLVDVMMWGTVLRDPENHPMESVAFVADITEQKKAEAELQASLDQIRQMQKMEALGQLAGGIAHDFNNLLTAILGNADLANTKLFVDHPVRTHLSRIQEAGRRASALVQQILAFTRQQDISRTIQPIAPTVNEALTLLRATLPAGINLIHVVDLTTPPALINATQIHQVLMNLCTNSWHALNDEPGQISVELKPVTLTEPFHSLQATLPPGLYACLSVQDTGCGMTPDTVTRIFDPFFTTKKPGQGTGLGLSVVHGIMQQHEGGIHIESVPGVGTTFSLYFPARQSASLSSVGENPVEALHQSRSESARHLLYLDDEEMLVELVKARFQLLGYRVTAFTNPKEALESVSANPNGFDVVVTDYNMPEMSGLEVARRVSAIRDTLPVILVSGYLTPENHAAALAAHIKDIVYKPTMLRELEPTICRLLVESEQTSH
ncbi:MAG: ATP-binding protein [Nitrospira sp.]|nr:ATP-binding protein [Nitrospira sp.]